MNFSALWGGIKKYAPVVAGGVASVAMPWAAPGIMGGALAGQLGLDQHRANEALAEKMTQYYKERGIAPPGAVTEDSTGGKSVAQKAQEQQGMPQPDAFAANPYGQGFRVLNPADALPGTTDRGIPMQSAIGGGIPIPPTPLLPGYDLTGAGNNQAQLDLARVIGGDDAAVQTQYNTNVNNFKLMTARNNWMATNAAKTDMNSLYANRDTQFGDVPMSEKTHLADREQARNQMTGSNNITGLNYGFSGDQSALNGLNTGGDVPAEAIAGSRDDWATQKVNAEAAEKLGVGSPGVGASEDAVARLFNIPQSTNAVQLGQDIRTGVTPDITKSVSNSAATASIPNQPTSSGVGGGAKNHKILGYSPTDLSNYELTYQKSVDKLDLFIDWNARTGGDLSKDPEVMDKIDPAEKERIDALADGQPGFLKDVIAYYAAVSIKAGILPSFDPEFYSKILSSADKTVSDLTLPPNVIKALQKRDETFVPYYQGDRNKVFWGANKDRVLSAWKSKEEMSTFDFIKTHSGGNPKLESAILNIIENNLAGG